MSDRFGADWAGRDGSAGGTRFQRLRGPARLVEVAGPAGDTQRVDPDDLTLPADVAEVAAGLRGLGSFPVYREG